MDSKQEEQDGNKEIHWSKWTAVGTMTMAICALITSLWQGFTLQQHNKLSVRPYLEFETNFRRHESDQIDFGIWLNNNGLGPADVTKVVFYIDGKEFNRSEQVWTELGITSAPDCLGSGHVQRFYKIDDKQMIISTTTPQCRLSEDDYKKLERSLRIELTYTSLYGENFKTAWGLKAQ